MASEVDDNHIGGQKDVVNENDHKLSIRIVGKLNHLTSTSSQCNIFKVPQHLRSVNQKAYEPYILAIGPYHRDKDHLKGMEEHKIQYLKEVLERRREKDVTGYEIEKDVTEYEIEKYVTEYVIALRALEEQARKCYAESISLDTDDFVEMMLLDGCFIIELLRRSMVEKVPRVDSSGDSFIFSSSITKKLSRDLLLVENQLPFFVLEKLFIMTSKEQTESYDLQHMILYFFAYLVFSDGRREFFRGTVKETTYEIKHLLSFIHEYWFTAIENYRSFRTDYVKSWWRLEPPLKKSSWWFILRLQKIYWSFKRRHNENYLRFMRCATELKEAGIKFKRVEGDGLFDIKFENGIMKIPRLEITGETESIFRNLIVYEQFSPGENFADAKLVSDYMKFMDCLVNSQKDVELLCNSNIRHNCLGDDESVANMFNRLGDFVTLSPNYYLNIFYQVNKHCGQHRHRWIANLRHRYFNTPWAFISFFAAVLLLQLTAAQTVYSVLAYYKGK